jgi:UDP-N-acetylmuramate dehydrogenase
MAFETTLANEILSPHFHQRLRQHEPLSQHSSFGVGGPADLWVVVETRDELRALVNLCARECWPLLTVGAGSNILYADAGVRGIVASIALPGYHLEEQAGETALLVAEAGVRWESLLKELATEGWGGLEFAAGIPGTLGAGVISNVGAHNQDVGQALEWIEVLDARGCNDDEKEAPSFPVVVLSRYQHDVLDLSYRHSRFREQRQTHIDAQGQLTFPHRGLIEPAELVVSLALHVHRQDPASLLALLERYARERHQTDPEQRHCGSIFKDPPGTTARALLKQAGVAGRIRGYAQISEYNPNYIVNVDGADASDIAALIVEAHQQVLTQSGIHMALNVELLGEWR